MTYVLVGGSPVYFNLKCVIATLVLATGYWFLPPHNKWVLLAILFFTYLALYWYDALFDCKRNPLGPTFLYHYYAWGKGKRYREEAARQWTPQTRRVVTLVDLAVLLVLVLAAPFFLQWRPLANVGGVAPTAQ